MRVKTDSTKCSGCTACYAVCPVNAIKMKPDEEGFALPAVDVIRCIDCGFCVSVCPVQTPVPQPKSEITAWAAYWDNPVREGSASGALFPALARYIIQEKQGYVCGCVLANMLPTHIVSNSWEDIVKMQDSKYVQSNMRFCYAQVVELLKKGQWVLFTGTSCQVAGLKSLLRQKKIAEDTLLTLDFFCHGVPSPKIWTDYLRFYEKQKGMKPQGYRFRSKEYGWGKSARGSSYLNSLYLENGRRDNVSWAARMWRTIFFSNLCIRPYCHTCPYATVDKPGDLTMGDFWGVDQILPEFDDGKGCSVALVRNEKAAQILREAGLTMRSVSVEDVIQKQANAFAPSSPNERRAEFWKDYAENGFPFVARKYFHYEPYFRLKAIVKRVLFALKLRNIY